MTDTARILSLHKSGLTARRIAVLARCDQEQVLKVLAEHNLKPRRSGGRNGPRVSRPPERKPPPLKVNPVRSALQILGSRATETGNGFTVDGRPVGVFDLIRKANAVLKEAGMPQLDACPEWIV